MYLKYFAPAVQCQLLFFKFIYIRLDTEIIFIIIDRGLLMKKKKKSVCHYMKIFSTCFDSFYLTDDFHKAVQQLPFLVVI